MIVKFEDIKGPNMEALLTFTHSKENRISEGGKLVVTAKSISPRYDEHGDAFYAVTLDIEAGKKIRDGNIIDLKRYLVRVYDIVEAELRS